MYEALFADAASLVYLAALFGTQEDLAGAVDLLGAVATSPVGRS